MAVDDATGKSQANGAQFVFFIIVSIGFDEIGGLFGPAAENVIECRGVGKMPLHGVAGVFFRKFFVGFFVKHAQANAPTPSNVSCQNGTKL